MPRWVRSPRDDTLGLRIDASGLAELAQHVKGVDKRMHLALRRSIRKAGTTMAGEIKRNASWSTRIPKAVRTKVSLTRRGAGVSIRVDATRAPHARALENAGKPGSFRHPVMGDRENWVSQQARPFFFQAGSAYVGQAQDDVLDAMARAATASGFRSRSER